MSLETTNKALHIQLEEHSFKGRIVSIDHVRELQERIRDQYRRGLFDEEFYQDELNIFDFSISESFPEAKSLIVVAAPQPQVRIRFNWEGKSIPCIIPPTYSYETDRRIKDILESLLRPKGYHLKRAILPLKLLAVHSGLAQYGRNNISYVQGLGSFHRLVAFYSDFPCLEDNWVELTIMEHCDRCSACIKNCPTDAIPKDRFLLRAEKCITFHNERQGQFPRWIKPSWHNCVVGCLLCQRICPIDKEFLKMIEEGFSFSHEETTSILRGMPKHKIPQETLMKLEKLDIIEYLDLLQRNLLVFMEKKRRSS